MKLRQTGREMQNAMENQAIMQVSQLAQMKGKQPHGHKKNYMHCTRSNVFHLIKASGKSSIFERVSDFTKCWFPRPKKIIACYCSDLISMTKVLIKHTMHTSCIWLFLSIRGTLFQRVLHLKPLYQPLSKFPTTHRFWHGIKLISCMHGNLTEKHFSPHQPGKQWWYMNIHVTIIIACSDHKWNGDGHKKVWGISIMS